MTEQTKDVKGKWSAMICGVSGNILKSLILVGGAGLKRSAKLDLGHGGGMDHREG